MCAQKARHLTLPKRGVPSLSLREDAGGEGF